jgi:hypothetical protein
VAARDNIYRRKIHQRVEHPAPGELVAREHPGEQRAEDRVEQRRGERRLADERGYGVEPLVDLASERTVVVATEPQGTPR